jgi:hypothetical protein
MKRYLLFVLKQTVPLLNEWQLQTLARQHGIRKDRETDLLDKLFTGSYVVLMREHSLVCLLKLPWSLPLGEARNERSPRGSHGL